MIPDDEPWWMVHRLQWDVSPLADGRKLAIHLADADADETEEPTDFRPFGYEW